VFWIVAVESVCEVAVPELIVATSSGLRNMAAKNCDDVSPFVKWRQNEPKSSGWTSWRCKQSSSQRVGKALFAPEVDECCATVIGHFQAKNRRTDWGHHQPATIPTVPA
jgi:hypothetical protein